MTRIRNGSCAVLAGLMMAVIGTTAHAQVVISQVYGAGGNSGATYRNDYVELFNRGSAYVDLTGWSIQYASATGTGNFGSNAVTVLVGTLGPGQYYLVQLAGGSTGAALPSPNATGTVNMSGTAGKVALVNIATGLACNGGSTPCSAAQLAQIVDLVGYGSANFYEGSGAAPTLSATTAALRASNGCADTNDNAADFTSGTPAPRNTGSPENPCGGGPVTDTAPFVTSVTPSNGASGIALDANITITFSEPVNAAADWFSVVCSTSGVVTSVVSGGPESFTIDPSTQLANDEACTLTVDATKVTDRDPIDPPDTMTANFTSSFTTVAVDPCTLPYTAIPSIQGSGATVAITGTVTTEGVVVGDYEGPSPALRGFFIQDPTGDGNPATSDGIFVFNGSNANSVSLGQVVRLTGTAGENQGQSQISVSSSNIIPCGTGTVEPVDVTFPVSSADYLERFEGMLVRLPQTMFVTEHFQLGRFGQVVLSSGGRLPQPTDVVAPGTAAIAVAAANSLNRVIVDDGSQAQNPDPIVFARGGLPLSASNTLRGGDTVTGLVGVMTYTWAGNSASGNAYRVRPVNAMNGAAYFEPSNPRPAAAPTVGGTLKIAGANLLNYYNTFSGCTAGVGAAPIDCRGANTQFEFGRQWPKTVSALLATGADVIGVIEVENDGYGPDSAIQDLVNRLNAATAPGTWAFVDADAGAGKVNALGSDGIKVGLLYQPARVTPVGQAAVLDTGAYGLFLLADGRIQQRNRPPLAQTFQTATGARVTVVVNHLISKSASCELNVSPVGPDPDTGDGQGACNLTRVAGVQELLAWLAEDPTGASDPDYVLLGDFNAYAKEDPIDVLASAGWADLVAGFGGTGTYSYAFDGQWGAIDHVVASPGLVGQVTGAAPFHVNADEPSVLDYNAEFKTSNLLNTLYAPGAFRAADHDPLVVGLTLNAAPIASAGGPYEVFQGGSVALQATGSDPDGGPVTFAWDLDNDGTFETPGQNVVFSSTDQVGTYTVRVRVTDEGGLSAVASTTVTVLFRWAGFFPPVEPYPGRNVARAGSAVPVKFSLGGDQGLAIFATGFPVSIPVDCSSQAPGPGSPTANPGHSGLAYDGFDDQYRYAWKTEKEWAGTCRLLVVQLVDGSIHQAIFGFR